MMSLQSLHPLLSSLHATRQVVETVVVKQQYPFSSSAESGKDLSFSAYARSEDKYSISLSGEEGKTVAGSGPNANKVKTNI